MTAYLNINTGRDWFIGKKDGGRGSFPGPSTRSISSRIGVGHDAIREWLPDACNLQLQDNDFVRRLANLHPRIKKKRLVTSVIVRKLLSTEMEVSWMELL